MAAAHGCIHALATRVSEAGTFASGVGGVVVLWRCSPEHIESFECKEAGTGLDSFPAVFVPGESVVTSTRKGFSYPIGWLHVTEVLARSAGNAVASARRPTHGTINHDDIIVSPP